MAAMEHPEAVRELSTISLSEIAIKCAIGKLELSRGDVLAAIDGFDIHMLALKTDHAFQMFGLPLHHSDPFDRQIIAQAMAENMPVVTPDPKFRLYRGIQVIW